MSDVGREATRIVESELSHREQSLVDRVRSLAQERFAPRAAAYDETGDYPAADFDDLVAAGLNAPTAPEEFGGLGIGPLRGASLSLWLMTKELAKVDLSLARCWEGHANSLLLLDGLANREQQERWFDGVVRRGESWAAWSGEPTAPALGQDARYGTTTEKVDGGYVVTGCKVFATSAGGAQWAILLVNTAGPGGARHATASPDTQLLLACDLADPGVVIDKSWWDPIGMRATASHLVQFNAVFIPEANVIGRPGQYLKEGWQTYFIPQYAASFLGAAEAAYEYALRYVKGSDKAEDPYIQHRIASMAINVQTAHLWLRHAAQLWDARRRTEAQLSGACARRLIEHLAVETMDHCVRICGARSLLRSSPIERMYRDLSIYVRHDNDDHLLANIGKMILGQAHDLSFYKP